MAKRQADKLPKSAVVVRRGQKRGATSALFLAEKKKTEAKLTKKATSLCTSIC